MKPNEKWIDDWKIGFEPGRENQVAAGLIEYFVDMVCRKFYKYLK